MPKLILKHKAEVLKELQLKNTKAMYSIGSDEENDIRIVDKRVSARHAAIERHGTRFFIRDLNSAFGTYFYGRRLEEPAELHSGDQIQIADFTLAFENPLESSAQDNGSPPQPSFREAEFSPGGEAFANQTEALTLEKQSGESQPLDNGVETSAKEKPAPTSVESRKEMAPYFLLAIYGPYAGKKFQLKYGETRIGRDSKFNDIIIRENMHGEIDPSISRRHATITYHDHSFFVMDKRSKTRTYVNQLEVPEDEEIALEHGDEIEIVSDQKSTIFRFVPEGNWDFSPPQKAGTWWVRYQPKLLRGAAVVAIVVGLMMGIGGWLSYSNIVQKPEPFKLEMTKWAIPGPSKRSARSATSRPAAASFRPVAAIADFTGNGYVDLAMLSGQQTPMLISGRKKRRTWRLDNLKVDPKYPLLAADLNNNHLKDLILVTTNGQVIAVDGKYGAEIFSSPYFQPPFSGAPVVGDFDADGWPDVAIAEQSGRLHIGFNRLVEMEWKTFDSGVGLMAPLTAADLDRDGDAEILCGSEGGLILIIDAAQLKIAGTVDINEELNKALGTFYVENQIRYPLGVADLNADNIPDLVCTSVQGNIFAINGATKKQFWYKSLVQDQVIDAQTAFPFALGDFDGDGRADVVAATPTGEIKAFSGMGSNKNSKLLWYYSPSNPAAPLGELLVSDLNKDGIADIIYLDRNNVLRILDGRNGKPIWNTGQPLAEETSMPLLADFGKNGSLDILLISKKNKIYQYQSNSRIPQSKVLWGQAFAAPSHVMISGFTLPGVFVPLSRLILGVVLVLGAAVLLVWNSRKYSQKSF